MTKLTLGVLGLALTTLGTACGDGGGSSGVDGSKTIVSLSASEKLDFCEFVIAEQGGPGHPIMCGDVTVTVQTVEECVAGFAGLPPTCAATVAQGEACATASGDDPCSFGGAACAAGFAWLPG